MSTVNNSCTPLDSVCAVCVYSQRCCSSHEVNTQWKLLQLIHTPTGYSPHTHTHTHNAHTHTPTHTHTTCTHTHTHPHTHTHTHTTCAHTHTQRAHTHTHTHTHTPTHTHTHLLCPDLPGCCRCRRGRTSCGRGGLRGAEPPPDSSSPYGGCSRISEELYSDNLRGDKTLFCVMCICSDKEYYRQPNESFTMYLHLGSDILYNSQSISMETTTSKNE